MVNCIICEDNNHLCNSLKAMIKDYFKKYNLSGRIKIFTDSYEDVIEYAKKCSKTTNVYFIDILLNSQSNGLMIAKEIRKYDFDGYIIFITGHLEFSFKVFQYKLKALDYIFKGDDNMRQRIFECLDVVRKEYNRHQLDKQNEKTLIIKTKSNQHIIPYKDIIFFETDTQSRKIILHTPSYKIKFNDTLSDLEKRLDSTFYRCHRSYIINLNHIKKVSMERNNLHVFMSNNHICLLSNKYLKGLMEHVDNNL